MRSSAFASLINLLTPERARIYGVFDNGIGLFRSHIVVCDDTRSDHCVKVDRS